MAKLLLIVALAAVLAVAASAPLRGTMLPLSPHARHLSGVARSLTSSCSISNARSCSIANSQCLHNLPTDDDKLGACSCFQQLGNCLNTAGCLNGTYEDLHTQYCETGDSYCCSSHGEFDGCGIRDDFSGSAMCLCEDMYGGQFCNTTNAVCSSTSSCNVCSKCCKDYSGETCEACTSEECDMNVCSTGSDCNVCSSCCKSYLEGPSVQADCNICVEQTCN